MKKLSSLILLILLVQPSFGQTKKKIDHTAYDEWKSIRSVVQSPTGNYVLYEVTPLEGDATLFFYDVRENVTTTFSRGKSGRFLRDESAFLFLVEPQFDTIHKLKLADTSKDKLPKDSLFIYWPATDSVRSFANIKSVTVPEEGSTVVFLSTKDARPDCPENPKKKKKKKKEKNPCTKAATSGTTLTLFNTATGHTTSIDCVTAYQLSEDGSKLLYVQSLKGKKDTLSLFLFDLTDSSHTQLISGQYGISQLNFDKAGNQIAFLATADTNKLKNYSLYYHSVKNDLTGSVVDSMNQSMPAGWNVSEFGKVFFSEDGLKLYFGTNALVVQEPEDSLLDTEIAKVDVWGSTDSRIQPQQLIELNADKRKAYTAVFYVADKKMVQLGSADVPDVSVNPQTPAQFILGRNDAPYQREATWEYPWKTDFYLIDQETGQATALANGLGFRTSLSPSANYFVYYNGSDSSWYAIHTQTKITANLSSHLNALFASDNNGNPSLADEQGLVGWSVVNGQEYVLVNARYDIWMLNPSDPQASICLTGEKGKAQKLKFDYYRLDTDSLYTIPENNYLIGVDEQTKRETIYRLTYTGQTYQQASLLSTDHRIALISKAELSDRVILRRMNFTTYPDLEKTDVTFANPVQFSAINPQQKEYNWGTVEMVSWKSFEGRNLRGLLYKPEDFDSTKSYPMIVYFYEKYTDDIHVYYAPKPTASIIYPTEYVSNGYIIFIPDIEYTPGYPAKSAYDCIVSGTDYLTGRFHWIDSTRLGLQGQSWGGYQTAQLITMTTKYKAAMAGAPVTNMFSAYGGIRWGSGISRMFQYEKTQSRIGYTLWERPDLYMLNSPVFGLPKVTTPLLIMSNDGDGAVPWYQGIEMYMGLRRLGKPVWLLNYNDDEHNLMQLANKRDLSIRMRQFFDYYLLGAPIPAWMSEGVPAVEKGKNFGFELENSGN
ncbi:MAG: S9 family peptidase [Bacteroidetes bacterium]|nr:S9 family peptidase [Bacteroidota bacterium]